MISGMEIGAQNKKIPTLKKLCFQEIAENLNQYSKNGDYWELSKEDKEYVKDVLGSLEAYELLQEFEESNANTFSVLRKESPPIPEIISSDGSKALYLDKKYKCEAKKSYDGDFESPKSVTYNRDLDFLFGLPPAFSPDGKWIFGWKLDEFNVWSGKFCAFDTETGNDVSRLENVRYRGKGWLHWDFESSGGLIFRDNKSLYRCKIDDFIKDGEKSLKNIYTRSEGMYPHCEYYPMIKVFSENYLVCIDPEEKSFELMEKKNDQWSCVAIQKALYGISSQKFASSRLLVACEGFGDTSRKIYFYSLDSKFLSRTGSIDIDKNYLKKFLFSPDGTQLVCSNQNPCGEIFIINCDEIENPVIVAKILVAKGSILTVRHWIKSRIFISNIHSQRYDIVNPLKLLIAAYKNKKNVSKKRKLNPVSVQQLTD